MPIREWWRAHTPVRGSGHRDARASAGPDLTFLVALVMAGVVAAMNGYKTDQGKNLGDAVIGKIKDAVDKVQF